MLGRADAVAAAVPETPETIGLMDAAAFAAMKPGSFFCNVGRGSLVDEPALIAALRRGQLAGAALDVASQRAAPRRRPAVGRAEPLPLAPRVDVAGLAVPEPARLFRANLDALPRRRGAGEPRSISSRGY